MKTLDKLIANHSDKEATINIEKLKQLEATRKEKEKAQRALDKKYSEEEAQINSEYENRLKQASEKYVESGSAILLSEIQRNYEALQQRYGELTIATSLTNEQKAQIEEARAILEEMDKEKASKLLNLMGVDEKMLTAVETGTRIDPINVFSYIAYGDIAGEETCAIITPIKASPIGSKENTELEEAFFEKLNGVIECGEIITSLTGTTNQKNLTVNARANKITYDADIHEHNGFAIYTLIPTDGTRAETLAKAMAKKLEDKNIQPKNFANAKITHKVEEVDIRLIRYLMKNRIRHNEESLPEGSFKADGPHLNEPQTPKRKRKTLDSKVEETKKPKREVSRHVDKEATIQAKERLNQYEGQEELTAKDLAIILNTSESAIYQKIKKDPKAFGAKKEGRKTTVPYQNVENFLNKYELSGIGWIKKKVIPRNRGLSLPGETPEERNAEAFERLREIKGNPIGIEHAQYILGLNTKASVQKAMGRPPYEISQIQEFIHNHKPAKTQWNPTKKKK